MENQITNILQLPDEMLELIIEYVLAPPEPEALASSVTLVCTKFYEMVCSVRSCKVVLNICECHCNYSCNSFIIHDDAIFDSIMASKRKFKKIDIINRHLDDMKSHEFLRIKEIITKYSGATALELWCMKTSERNFFEWINELTKLERLKIWTCKFESPLISEKDELNLLNLKELDLYNCTHNKKSKFLTSFPADVLHEVSLRTDLNTQDFFRKQKNIKILLVDRVDPQALRHVKLTRFTILVAYQKGPKDDDVAEVLAYQPSLVAVEFGKHYSPKNCVFIALCQTATQLEHLEFDIGFITPKIFEKLRNLKRLKTLKILVGSSLLGCIAQKHDFAAFSLNKNEYLQHLQLVSYGEMTTQTFLQMGHNMPNITYLDITSVTFDRQHCLNIILNCFANLRELHIYGDGKNFEDLYYDDGVVRPNLICMVLNDTTISKSVECNLLLALQKSMMPQVGQLDIRLYIKFSKDLGKTFLDNMDQLNKFLYMSDGAMHFSIDDIFDEDDITVIGDLCKLHNVSFFCEKSAENIKNLITALRDKYGIAIAEIDHEYCYQFYHDRSLN